MKAAAERTRFAPVSSAEFITPLFLRIAIALLDALNSIGRVMIEHRTAKENRMMPMVIRASKAPKTNPPITRMGPNLDPKEATGYTVFRTARGKYDLECWMACPDS